MMTVDGKLYGLAMLACGYGAGKYRADKGEWPINLPWWIHLSIGGALFIFAVIINYRRERREQ